MDSGDAVVRFIATLVSVLACVAVYASDPIEEGCIAFHAGDRETARRLWQPLAVEGDARAQFGMAMLAAEDEERLRWAAMAAEQSHPEACYWMYRFKWTSDPPDKQTALEWLEKSANNGFADAAEELGGILRFGTDVPKDCPRAVHFLEIGAKAGSGQAAWWLGGLYGSGECVDADAVLQARWYRRGAELGHPLAARYLSAMYYEGRGVPQNDRQSVLWALVFDANLKREDLPPLMSITEEEFERVASETATLRADGERKPPPRCP